MLKSSHDITKKQTLCFVSSLWPLSVQSCKPTTLQLKDISNFFFFCQKCIYIKLFYLFFSHWATGQGIWSSGALWWYRTLKLSSNCVMSWHPFHSPLLMNDGKILKSERPGSSKLLAVSVDSTLQIALSIKSYHIFHSFFPYSHWSSKVVFGCSWWHQTHRLFYNHMVSSHNPFIGYS